MERALPGLRTGGRGIGRLRGAGGQTQATTGAVRLGVEEASRGVSKRTRLGSISPDGERAWGEGRA